MWICSQIGAREHYAVPRALHQAGRLDSLYTGFWARAGLRFLAAPLGSRALRSLAARFHRDLNAAPVVSWNLRSIGWEAELRRQSRFGGAAGRYLGYVEFGRRFACKVRDSLCRRGELSRTTVFFGYDTGALETMQWLRERGIPSVVNQMDPSRVETNLVREEEKRWPGWQSCIADVPDEYFQRREQEWALADRVVVNSEFCRHALEEQGVPPEKLVEVPLCYETASPGEETYTRNAGTRTFDSRAATCGPLTVLWLGQVILRKGIQYLLQAARQLESEKIGFEVVGPIGISKDAVATAPSNVTFHGRVNRDQAAQWYRNSDVFVLPTLSDGFAITQLEAMAHGLPVITTHCCGTVVTDGIDGFRLAPRDATALAQALLRYVSDPNLLRDHQVAALQKSRQFTIRRLAERLLLLEADLAQRQGESSLKTKKN